MQQSQGQFVGARGATIYYQAWSGQAPIRAVLVVAHGAAEHGGRYAGLAQYFTDRHYAVVALDHDGHGKSDGKRCCLRSFDDYVEDLATLQRRAAVDFPEAPQVLLGHSLGGLIACNLLLHKQDKFVACVLSGAAIMTDLQPPNYQRVLIRLLSRVLPNLGVLKLDASGVSRDAAEVQKYVEDPLNHSGALSVRLVAEMFKAMSTVQDNAPAITLPMLILHGGADTMTSPRGSQFLYDNIASADKWLTVYPGLYHEIFNEPERLAVLAEVEQWLDARLNHTASAW